MSELINNSKFRKEKLRNLIQSLHEGRDFDEVKTEFEKEFGSISTQELSELEKELINEGIEVEEIQRLCDVHAEVMGKSIQELHKNNNAEIAGHPVNVLINENKAIEKVVNEEVILNLESYLENEDNNSMLNLRIGLDRLSEVDIHYMRKENLFFPYLEKHGVTAPPKVMWGVDDEIREEIKEAIKITSKPIEDKNKLEAVVRKATNNILSMIDKENNILVPLLNDTLTFNEWIKIDEATPEIGYCLVVPEKLWNAETSEEVKEEVSQPSAGDIAFDAGSLSSEEVNALLNTLPLDMTFVDKNDRVKYFSQGKERIFARPKTVIGREVSLCHPPASVGIVEEIVNSFKTGEKDHEDFWIKLGDKFVYIRYFAVRNKEGKYLGVLETSQDIKPITELEGEKRLVSKWYMVSCVHKVPIFAHLTEEEMAEIMKIAGHKTYRKGEMIYLAGDMDSNLYVVNSGKLKVSRISDTGKEQVIRFVSTGDFIGELSLFNNKPRTDFAQAIEDSSICYLEGKKVQGKMQQHPQIAFKILEEIANRLEKSENLLEGINLYPVDKRIAQTFMRMAKNDVVLLSSSKGDFALQLGMSPETLSRKLTQFEEDGLIKQIGHRKIIILDPEGLAHLE